MGIKSERVLSRLGLFFSILVLSALGPTGVHSTAEQTSDAHDYVLKVSDVAKASELVEAIGGRINHTMPTLGYVGAQLSQQQVQLVSRSALVSRISAGSDKLAGWWWYDVAVPETPDFDEDSTLVAGWWWYPAVPETIPEIDDATTVAGWWWYPAVPEIPTTEEPESDAVLEAYDSGKLAVQIT